MRTLTPLLLLLLSTGIAPTAAGQAPTRGGPPASPAAVPTTSPAAAGAANEFAHFGVAVPTPPPAPAWKRILEGGFGHIARWAQNGAGGKVDALLTLELQRHESADAFAALVAKRAGGQSAPAPDGVTVGGEKAFRITGMKQGQLFTEGLVARHGEYCYVVSGFANTLATIPRQQMEATARSLRFVPMAEPWTQTKLRGERFPIFENRVLIEPLATMRPDPQPAPAGQISVSAVNFIRRHADVILNLQLVPNPRGTPMPDLQQALGVKLAAPGENVTWTELKQSPAGATLSSTFLGAIGKERAKLRLALVPFPGATPADNQTMLVIFTFANDDPRAIAAYEKASEAVVNSIERVKR